MRPRKLSASGQHEIEEAARARFVIPTDKELAFRNDISLRYVQLLMRKIRRQLLRERAKSTPHPSATIQPQVSDLERLADEIHEQHVTRETWRDPLARPYSPRSRPKPESITTPVLVGARKP